MRNLTIYTTTELLSEYRKHVRMVTINNQMIDMCAVDKEIYSAMNADSERKNEKILDEIGARMPPSLEGELYEMLAQTKVCIQ